LFDAEKPEDIDRIAELEAPIMTEAIEAYKATIASEKFKLLERMRSDAKNLDDGPVSRQ
jgi:hypothetical protein